MEAGAEGRKRPSNPRARASPLSALTFAWVLGTFKRGYKRDLQVEDLPEALPEHRSDVLGDLFERLWADERRRRRPSLTRALVRAFGGRLALYGAVLAVMEIALRVAQPIFLGRLVRAFAQTEGEGEEAVPREAALGYAAGVVVCSAVNIFVIHPYMMAIFHLGMKMRVAACALVFRKALRLSRAALGEASPGQTVNLLANDVGRFDLAVIFLHYLWIGPLETALATYVMWGEVGWAALAGVGAIMLFVPLQAFLGQRSSVLRLRTAMSSDERMRLMNEIIAGVQVIKMYAWERPFAALVAGVRSRELRWLTQTAYIRGTVLSFIMFNTRIAIFVTVLAYVLLYPGAGAVSAEKVFVVTAYYNILRQTMTVFFPQGLTQLAEALVSVRRIEMFLQYEETPRAAEAEAKGAKGKDKGDEPFLPHPEPLVELRHASARWGRHEGEGEAKGEGEGEDTLSDVSLRVGPGQCVAVVGQVGAGKTSLLHALLRELPLRAGSVTVRGRVAYASQEPWMFAGSVRQNVLFGQPFDRQRYSQVLSACALRTDLKQLPYGDKTIVGERGISLSGGQRARINLARAVYKDADIYLLDDPLSAVDAHVGRHLFDECIKGFLVGKIVVLITHQLQYLRDMDKIYVMENGAIRREGTFMELQEAGTDFSELIESDDVEDGNDSGAKRRRSPSPLRTSRSSVSSVDDAFAKSPIEEAESRSYGTVSGTVYRLYFAAGGNCCVIVTMFLFCIAAQVAASGSDYWITYWTKSEEAHYTNLSSSSYPLTGKDDTNLLSREYCIYIYTAIIGAVVILSLLRSFIFFKVCIRASQRLHDAMFSCITRAKMHFFNVTPSGRIINRFSKDMFAVDELLPQCMVDTLQIGLALLGIIVVLAIVNVWLLIPTTVIGFTFYVLRRFYLSTSRSVKRLEGITRSPVFSHLNASLQGLTTIRAFEAERILIKEFDNLQDVNSSAWYLFIATSRAFGFWLDIICVAYITIVTFSFLMMDTDVFGGNVGLAITQAIALTGMFQWGMRQSAEMENQMTSVERILEYRNVETEPPLESAPGKEPPPAWPQRGCIEFKGVSLWYNTTEPPVLKNLNFTIQSGEKVGIVGRTGAGKSSLISALFRLAELEGTILLDDIDTGSIGLHDLRSKISIIPQEPVLFTGTLRKNLDPFDEFADAVLLKALNEVELGEMIHDLPAGLSTKVSEGGSNFSVGQRQLICLARAILRNNCVLVLDEATANVDPQTDAFIQRTIRQKFAKCTVLTIAHRLHTVMDSSRVLVMDAGSVVEFGHPHDLLRNEEGHLYRMVQTTGRSMAEQLTKIAEATHNHASNVEK